MTADYLKLLELLLKFTSVAVYVPLHANAKLVMDKLLSVDSTDSIVITSGAFVHASLSSVLHKVYKNVNFPTREKNILNKV